LFYIYKPIGASPAGHFVWGGRGRFGKKGVISLRGLRISEKKEILRKLTVCTYIRTYLSTLSTKDFAKINKIPMVTPFAGSYCMTMIFLAPPPRCNLFAMDCLRALSKDFIELCKLAKKKIN
jgi:hypothetical protein